MKVLELFCGTKSFAKVAEARGHECLTLDIDHRFKPDLHMDIMDFSPSMLNGFHPDVIWASPPCTHFSVASLGKNWRHNDNATAFIPVSEGAVQSMRMVQKLLEDIRAIAPTFYFIENPRAMLRKMHFMKGWPRSTVTYCKYGAPYQKPTDIWNNCLQWKPRPMCRPRDPCHIRAPRGSKKGIQGVTAEGGHGQRRDWSLSTAQLRGIVPVELCEEIIIACEAGSTN